MKKSSGISLLKVAIFGAVIGVFFIVGGIFTLANEQNSRREPLNIEPFPNAELWGDPISRTATSREIFFKVGGASVEDVVEFYQQSLNEFNSHTSERCVRTPATGNMPVFQNVPNSIPYRYDCMFDRSGMNSTQFTQVTISPGTRNADPFYNVEGMTVIQYQQEWQP